MNRVTVVGAGLAGCEAAWQLAKRGIKVALVDMKPYRKSPAHSSDLFSELVCSNSLKAEQISNASGLLKAEMGLVGSVILSCAALARVPAGGALAVDRDIFSALVTQKMESEPNIEIFRSSLIAELPEPPAIIATGPLTDEALVRSIEALPGMAPLHFFDAAAPVVTAQSIDMSRVFRASRYDNGSDYLNCPMSRAEYDAFYDSLVSAETADPHGFEKNLVFEGCLAVEILAARGRQTLAFGPMKPVGLTDPATGKPPYAAVQLRQDNLEGTLYNLVGFQTRLKWGEQKRVFSMIPGLERAEFARYGVMHRNTYLSSPEALGRNYACKSNPFLRFAGQLTGVEGYIESAASGMVAAIGLADALTGRPERDFTGKTMLGALEKYVRTPSADFQPMNANFGILEKMSERVRARRDRYSKLAERALEVIKEVMA